MAEQEVISVNVPCRILGIDPGTNVMGYALLDTVGKKSEVVCLDVLKMKNGEDHTAKLKMIFDGVSEIVSTYHPQVLAIEEPFYGKNVQSMLKLGRAQGVAMAACLRYGLPVFEYTPRRVKQAITGNGNAAKEQVAAMLLSLYPNLEEPSYLDATDALAIAFCHHLQSTNPIFQNPKVSGWKSFITQNSDRIIK